MATITREISIDVAKLNRFAAIVAKQYDKQSRFLKVTLLNNDEPIQVDKNATVLINARREDNVGKSFVGTTNEDGTVTVPLTYWMLELDGTVKCDISIIVGEEVTLTTTLFELEVEEAACDNESIGQDDDYGLLVTLIKEVKDALTAEETRVKNEQTRKTNEDTRKENENTRKQQESSRVQAETARVNAENSRVEAENQRVTNEAARSNAEQSRVAAEKARQSAETERQNTNAAAKQAIENCEQVVAAAQLVVAPFFINDVDNNKQYTASIQVKDGKPVLIYDELTT